MGPPGQFGYGPRRSRFLVQQGQGPGNGGVAGAGSPAGGHHVGALHADAHQMQQQQVQDPVQGALLPQVREGELALEQSQQGRIGLLSR